MRINTNVAIYQQPCSGFKPRTNGQNIATLEKLLTILDNQERDIKHRMQDRMKFMSGKNAFRADRQLTEIEQTRELIKKELSELQAKSKI